MTAILVLAQGRTGTSTVAGILHHLGVYMGEGLLPSTPDNEKGSFEDRTFFEWARAAVGNHWKNPRPDSKWVADIESWFTARNKLWDVWGLKAPLLCFTLPMLVSYLPDDTRFIMPLRPAQAVIKSIAAMADVSGMDEAAEIFQRYTQALVATELGLPTKWPRLSILYDDIVADPKMAVARIAAFAGVYPNQAAEDFVDERLRHW